MDNLYRITELENTVVKLIDRITVLETAKKSAELDLGAAIDNVNSDLIDVEMRLDDIEAITGSL